MFRWSTRSAEFFYVHPGVQAGPPGIPVLKTQNSPPPPNKKIPENSRSVKCLILHALTIGTQTSNIYLKFESITMIGQFAEVYMLLEVLSLEIYPNVSVTNSFPSVPHVDWPAAIDHRSVVSTTAPVRTDIPRTLGHLIKWIQSGVNSGVKNGVNSGVIFFIKWPIASSLP